MFRQGMCEVTMVFTIHLAKVNTIREQRHFLSVKLDLCRQKAKVKAKGISAEVWYGSFGPKRILLMARQRAFCPKILGDGRDLEKNTLPFYEC